ncbi:hypothetical protein CN357_03405 [Bacillus cereus]|uniref:Uncharacterized protein n=2 Tax=Bacillus TaxID=1386 RepID=A0A9X6W1I9_BACCE|nr:hypothetical protein CN357_03405 [Bacillus cereus]PGB10120.1 hypothetical protein COM09_23940 [Bacillus toyonensis]
MNMIDEKKESVIDWIWSRYGKCSDSFMYHLIEINLPFLNLSEKVRNKEKKSIIIDTEEMKKQFIEEIDYIKRTEGKT